MRRILYDITRPMQEGVPVWPGDAPFRLDWTQTKRDGHPVNLSELHFSAHTGTHVDAPFHCSDDGRRVGEMALDPFVGEVLLIDAQGWPAISAEFLHPMLADRPERLLIRTNCWLRHDRFPEAFPPIEPAAADLLASSGVRLVGTDAPSVDPLESTGLPTHQIFRRSGIYNLESLLLDGVPTGSYHLIALPLRLEEADASPVRAVLCSVDA